MWEAEGSEAERRRGLDACELEAWSVGLGVRLWVWGDASKICREFMKKKNHEILIITGRGNRGISWYLGVADQTGADFIPKSSKNK